METTTIENSGGAALMCREIIGTCEICGATDHHLAEGICSTCRPKCRALTAAGAAQILRNIETFACDTFAHGPLVPDEQLEFWGDYFVRERLHAEGVLFGTFIRCPHEIAQAFVMRRLDQPARRRVRALPHPIGDSDLVFLRKQAD